MSPRVKDWYVSAYNPTNGATKITVVSSDSRKGAITIVRLLLGRPWVITGANDGR